MNLPEFCTYLFIYLFIYLCIYLMYLISFSQEPSSHKVKGSSNGVLSDWVIGIPPPVHPILILENRPDGGARE